MEKSKKDTPGHEVLSTEDLQFDPHGYADLAEQGAESTEDADDNMEDHIIVKSEFYEEEFEEIEDSSDYSQGYLPHNTEDPLFQISQYDDGSEGGAYVREMVTGTKEQNKRRLQARRENSEQRKDCPVCGDRVNGIHYGIYTCEGCKNFFKRSMSIKKPYLCNNMGNCDIGVFLDHSGIKRKGTRCQACRFASCLDAGMIHQGHNRTTGRPRRTLKLTSPNQKAASPKSTKRQRLMNVGTNCYQDSGLDGQLEITDCTSGASSEDKSILESMLAAPMKDCAQAKEFTTKPSTIASSDTHTGMFETDDAETNRLLEENEKLAESLFREQIQYERKKNQELERQLRSKDEQIKSLEVCLAMMEKHMHSTQAISSKQKAEINRLKGEIKRLGLFKNLVNNSQRTVSSLQNGHGDGEGRCYGGPTRFVSTDDTDICVKVEPTIH